MTINTKKVLGRRTVRYESLDECLADAERVASSQVRTLGNWSPGQIFEHLARALDASIDGFDMSMPAPARFMMSLLFKRTFLKKALPAGFKSTSTFIPDETSTEAGLASLRSAIERQKQESARVPHPAFGKISSDEWNDFHLRHAEMHMSFLTEDE